jgi:dGTPase
VASIADQIAYRSHDVEDTITAGILSEADWRGAGVTLWDEVWAEMGEISDARVRLPQVTRRLINRMVTDVLAETARRLKANNISSLDDVYNASAVLVDFSAELTPRNDELGAFLMASFYHDYRVRRGTAKGQMIIARLFDYFEEHGKNNVVLLPPVEATHYREARLKGRDRLGREALRVIADYIAGMTDREAYDLYVKLFEVGHG